MSSFSSISLNSDFLLTPGSPLLTSPAHTTAIVSILLDSQARYRSHAPVYEHALIDGRGSPDVPNTPELSPDSSLEVIRYDSRRGSEVTPPSPTPQSRLASSNHSKRPSYQPRSLVLVEKHLSAVKQNTTILAVKDGNKAIAAAAAEPVQAVVKKSTKGWKPRALPVTQQNQEGKARSPVKKPTSIRPILTPGRKVRSTASSSNNNNKRAMTVYSDEIVSALSETGRNPTNSFLLGRTLSTRRRDAFTAARRKLEGIGAPEEQNSGSSGTSENDDTAVITKGLKLECNTLEARGSVETVE